MNSLCLLLALSGAAPPIERVAFMSCFAQDRPSPILAAIVRFDPQLVLWLGDNVYLNPESGQDLAAEYGKLAAAPGFSELRSRETLATWDDGESGMNDGGADNPHLAATRAAFVEFWRPDWLAAADGRGLFGSRVYGPVGKRVQVIVLDTRTYRSPLRPKPADDPTPGRYDPDPDPTKTLLGEAQWAWLRSTLSEPAEIRVVMSSIQVVPEDHKWEKWANLPTERTRLFATIRETGANGVVFVSGDRHLGEISMVDAGVGYPLFEVTASALNNSWTDWRPLEPNRHRVATMNVGHNFGAMTVDWSAEDPEIRLQVRDEQGEVALQQRLLLSWLRPGKITLPPRGGA